MQRIDTTSDKPLSKRAMSKGHTTAMRPPPTRMLNPQEMLSHFEALHARRAGQDKEFQREFLRLKAKYPTLTQALLKRAAVDYFLTVLAGTARG